MKHYLFVCTAEDSDNEGEEFLVGASTLEEAFQIANNNFEKVEFECALCDFEAELSGLDEY